MLISGSMKFHIKEMKWPEAYPGPLQTYKVESFATLING